MSARRAEIEAKRAKLERMRQERAARQQRAQGLGESQGKQEVGPLADVDAVAQGRSRRARRVADHTGRARGGRGLARRQHCLLYTSDAADE